MAVVASGYNTAQAFYDALSFACSQAAEDVVRAPPDQIFRVQGRAQGLAEILKVLTNARATVERTKEKQRARSSSPG